MKIQLIIFDVDGTLAESYTLNLLPGVESFFHLVFQKECPERPKIAIATNQGGVGMRYWMERSGFGNPEEYPTEESINKRMRHLVSALGGGPDLQVYTSFSYRSKQGQWGPVPPGHEDDPRWSDAWRKPGPGMLLEAMRDAGVGAGQTLFVGNSDEDWGAAHAAGCSFMEAGEFFGHEWFSCEELARLEGSE